LSQRLTLFITAICVAAAVIWFCMPPLFSAPNFVHYAMWTLACVVAGALWLPTVSGEATDSMASTADFAVIVLWGLTPALYIVPLSTLFQNLVQRRPFIRVLYNPVAMVIVTAAAGAVFHALGGPSDGLYKHMMQGEFHSWGEELSLIVPFVAMGLTYRASNILLTAIPVSWSTERPFGKVLTEDFVYGEQLLSDLALLFLAPIMVISFLSLQYVGVLLFYAPLVVIRDSHRRFVELRRAQDQIIHSERMAAKGEMAAEIGHELSNYLAVISGRAQILVMEATASENPKLERNARMIYEQAANMAILTRGLMDFSHREIKIQRVDVNDLISRTVEFVRPQNKYDGVEFELDLAESLVPIAADPGQLQQVFLNLFGNAADAMVEKNSPKKRIRVVSRAKSKEDTIEVLIADTGPGMSKATIASIFEPGFTTKPAGHGFGLSTSYRIISLHGGQISAESEVGRGATFKVVLPIRAGVPFPEGA
jgi:signal transduction histidine kinase